MSMDKKHVVFYSIKIIGNLFSAFSWHQALLIESNILRNQVHVDNEVSHSVFNLIINCFFVILKTIVTILKDCVLVIRMILISSQTQGNTSTSSFPVLRNN